MNATSSSSLHSTALVLGGGGSAGNAWLIGVIAGLFDAGLDVTMADLVIGTSAGSTTAAQITSTTPTQLMAAILSAAPQAGSVAVASERGRAPIRPATDHLERTGKIIAASADAADMRRKMGAAALELDGVSDGSAPIAVARYYRRPTSQPALADTNGAHPGGRCP